MDIMYVLLMVSFWLTLQALIAGCRKLKERGHER